MTPRVTKHEYSQWVAPRTFNNLRLFSKESQCPKGIRPDKHPSIKVSTAVGRSSKPPDRIVGLPDISNNVGPVKPFRAHFRVRSKEIALLRRQSGTSSAGGYMRSGMISSGCGRVGSQRTRFSAISQRSP